MLNNKLIHSMPFLRLFLFWIIPTFDIVSSLFKRSTLQQYDSSSMQYSTLERMLLTVKFTTVFCCIKACRVSRDTRRSKFFCEYSWFLYQYSLECRNCFCGSMAEHLSSEEKVVGSSPTRSDQNNNSFCPPGFITWLFIPQVTNLFTTLCIVRTP